MRRVNYVGKQFGQLTVLKREDRKIGHKSIAFLYCECSCGNRKWIRYNNLVNKNTVSCGCFQKSELSKRSRKEDGESAIHSVFSYYKRNAKLRNLDWNLSKDDFVRLISSPCAYCGQENSMFAKTKYRQGAFHNGIDRIDSSKGYFSENCNPCCNVCNRAKNDMPHDEFIGWIKRLKEF